MKTPPVVDRGTAAEPAPALVIVPRFHLTSSLSESTRFRTADLRRTGMSSISQRRPSVEAPGPKGASQEARISGIGGADRCSGRGAGPP